MGSWNGTCGLTQMPIKEGEKVVLFPLLRNKNANNGGNGFCHSNNQYTPISLPLFGEYDDYGKIKNISRNENLVLNFFQKIFKQKSYYGLILDEKKYDRAKENSSFSGEVTDIKTLIQWFMSKPLYKGLGFMLVHEDIYFKVIQEIGSRKSWNSHQTKKKQLMDHAHSFLTETQSILLDEETIENQITELRSLRNSHVFKDNEYLDKIAPLLNKQRVIYGAYQDHFAHRNSFVRHFSDQKTNSYIFPELLNELVSIQDKNEQVNFLEELVHLILFDSGMDLMRKTWSPQNGAGSPTNEYYLHRLLAHSILEKEARVVAEWFEENDSVEEEDVHHGLNITKDQS